jgi:hypothetical protein
MITDMSHVLLMPQRSMYQMERLFRRQHATMFFLEQQRSMKYFPQWDVFRHQHDLYVRWATAFNGDISRMSLPSPSW